MRCLSSAVRDTGNVKPQGSVIRAGSRERWFGAALSLLKWDWICDFVAQSPGCISKASNNSLKRIKHFSGRLEEIWSFYCAPNSLANGKLATPLLPSFRGRVPLLICRFHRLRLPVIWGTAVIRLQEKVSLRHLRWPIGLVSSIEWIPHSQRREILAHSRTLRERAQVPAAFMEKAQFRRPLNTGSALSPLCAIT